MSYPPPSGAGGYPGYPPTGGPGGAGGYPGAPSGTFSPAGASGYPPQQQQGAHPGQQPPYGQQPGAQQPGAYPGQPPYGQQPGGAYPPQNKPATGYPPAQSGYPPQQGGYPAQTPGAYPGATPQATGYPSTPAYNPSAPPPYSPGYPPQSGGGYQPQSGYPPTPGYSPAGYPPQGGAPPGGAPPGGAPPGGAPAGSAPYGAQQGPQAWYGQYYNQIDPQQMQVLQAWFASVDRDRSGEISAQELASLNFNNRLLGQEPARKLIAIFDKDRSGQISFQEYASLHQFLNTLLAQFQQAERSTPGFISVNALSPALAAASFNLSPNAVNNMARRFDTQKRGQLTWEDFLALASHVALLKSVFEWSDTDRDGKITFDFESFAFATLYL